MSKPKHRQAFAATPAPREVFSRRWVIGAVSISILAITTVIAAQQSFIVVVYRCLTDGVLAVLWLLAALGIGDEVVGKGGGIRSRAALRVAMSCGAGMGAIGLIMLGLGLMGAM